MCAALFWQRCSWDTEYLLIPHRGQWHPVWIIIICYILESSSIRAPKYWACEQTVGCRSNVSGPGVFWYLYSNPGDSLMLYKVNNGLNLNVGAAHRHDRTPCCLKKQQKNKTKTLTCLVSRYLASITITNTNAPEVHSITSYWQVLDVCDGIVCTQKAKNKQSAVTRHCRLCFHCPCLYSAAAQDCVDKALTI